MSEPNDTAATESDPLHRTEPAQDRDPDPPSATPEKEGGTTPPPQSSTDRMTDRVVSKFLTKNAAFSTRRPQHAIAGISSGAKNLLRGVTGGVASFVGLPVLGYRSEGMTGAAKGLAMGTLTCGALTIGGVATCAMQVGRGVVNTFEAMRERYANVRMWHPGRREWIDVRLQSDAQNVPTDDSDLINAARQREPQEPQPSDPSAGGARETSYYAALDIPQTATPSQIKQAYAKQALKHHPDKNVGDPTAAERFKLINAAYRVLSDPVQRAEYDRTGRVEGGMSHIQLPGLQLHPLQEMLGGEAFLPWIGHLHLTVIYLNPYFTFTEEEESEWQRRRELRIAQHLAQFTASARDLERADGPIAVSEFFVRVAGSLLGSNIGKELAALLGSRIALVASRWQAVSQRRFIDMSCTVGQDLLQSASSIAATASTTFNIVRAVQRRESITDGSHTDTFASMLLRIAEGDIIETVDTAVDMALHDHSVSPDECWERSHYLKQFAEVLKAAPHGTAV